jgi:hypothetical protein
MRAFWRWVFIIAGACSFVIAVRTAVTQLSVPWESAVFAYLSLGILQIAAGIRE